MSELDYKFYLNLPNRSTSLNQVPKRIKNSVYFKNLLEAKTICTEKSGRGSKIIINNIDSYNKAFSRKFPINEDAAITKASNIRRHRNSKARKTDTLPVFFIRGFKAIKLNNENINLPYFTNSFGLFSVREPSIDCEKICFVENLDSFLKAEKIFGDEFIYLHKYGRIGVKSLKNVSAREVKVFVDYDFNGMDEYLRIKNVFDNATLHIPDDFKLLFETYSKTINGKQKPSKRVLESKISEVVMIRELVLRKSQFLEQEILIHD